MNKKGIKRIIIVLVIMLSLFFITDKAYAYSIKYYVGNNEVTNLSPNSYTSSSDGDQFLPIDNDSTLIEYMENHYTNKKVTGWYINSNLEGTVYRQIKDIKSLNQDVILYAKIVDKQLSVIYHYKDNDWHDEVYIETYNTNDDGVLSSQINYSLEVNPKVDKSIIFVSSRGNLTGSIRYRYRLNKWYDDDGNNYSISNVSPGQYTTSEDLHLYADYSMNPPSVNVEHMRHCYNLNNKECIGYTLTENSGVVDYPLATSNENSTNYDNFRHYVTDNLTDPIDIYLYPVYQDKTSYQITFGKPEFCYEGHPEAGCLYGYSDYSRYNFQRGETIYIPTIDELYSNSDTLIDYGNALDKYQSIPLMTIADTGSYYRRVDWHPTITIHWNNENNDVDVKTYTTGSSSFNVEFWVKRIVGDLYYIDEMGDSHTIPWGQNYTFDAYVDLNMYVSESSYDTAEQGTLRNNYVLTNPPQSFLRTEGLTPSYYDKDRVEYDFVGWYDAPEGGNLVNSTTSINKYLSEEKTSELYNKWTTALQTNELQEFEGFDNIDIYAHWEKKRITVTNSVTGDVSVYEYGDDYTFGTNLGELDEAETLYTYTFEYLDNHTETRDVMDGIASEGWKDQNNNHYDNNQTITLTENLTISYGYEQYVVRYPEFPTLQNGNVWVDSNNKVYLSYKKNENKTFYEHVDNFEYTISFGIDTSLEDDFVIDYENAEFSKTGVHTGDAFTTPSFSDFKDGVCFMNCYEYKYPHQYMNKFLSNNTWKPIVKFNYNNGTDDYETSDLVYGYRSHKTGYKIDANNTTYNLDLGQTYIFDYNTNISEVPTKINSSYNYNNVNIHYTTEFDGTMIVTEAITPPASAIPEGKQFVGWFTLPEGGRLIDSVTSLNRFQTYEEGLSFFNMVVNAEATNTQITGYEGYGEPIELYAHYAPIQSEIIVHNYEDRQDQPTISVYNYGDEFTFPTVSDQKSGNVTITFDYANGNTDTGLYTWTKTKTGWYAMATWPDNYENISRYYDGDTITLYRDLDIYYYYDYSFEPTELPENQEGYAWYDEDNNLYTKYEWVFDDITLYERTTETYKLIFALDTNDDNSLIENPSYSSTSMRDGDTFTTPSTSDYSTGFCRNPLDCQKNIHTYFPIEYFISNDNEWRPTAVLHYMDENDTTITSTTGNIWSDTEMFWIDGLKTGYTISYDDFTQDLDLNSSYTFNYGRDITDVVINGMTKNMSARITPNGLALRIPVNLNPNGNSNQVEHPGVPQGYLFDGWYTEPNGQGIKYDNMDNPTGGIETFRFRLMSNDDVAYLFDNVSGWRTDNYQWISAKLSNYEGFEPIHLYANYVPQQFSVTTTYNVNEAPDVRIYNYGETHTFGVNDSTYPEGNSVAAVTFMYADNTSEVRYVVYEERADGWIGSEEPDILTGSNIRFFADNETITVTNDLYVMRHSLETNYSPEFPTPREGYAWFDSNGTKYTSYDGEEDITLYELEDSETYSLSFRVDADEQGNLNDNPRYSYTNIHNGQTFTTPSFDDYEDGFCRYEWDCIYHKKTYIPIQHLLDDSNEWRPTLIIHYMDENDTVVVNPVDDEYLDSSNFWVEMTKTGYRISYDDFYQELDYDTTYTFNYGRDVSEVNYNASGPYWGRNMSATGVANGIVFHIPSSVHPNAVGIRREGSMFGGWYSQPNGEGTKYTYGYDNVAASAEDATALLNSVDGWYVDDYPDIDYPLTNYTGFEPIHVYAKWDPIQYEVKYMYDTPEIVLVDPGDTHTLRNNNVDKPADIISTITFTGSGTGYVTRGYQTNGWLINDQVYANGATITVNEPIDVYPNYYTNIYSLNFPTPTGNGTFVGWFTEPNGEGNLVKSYTGEEDITLYPYFEVAEDDEHIVVIDGTYMGIYHNNETLNIDHFSSDDVEQSGLLKLMNNGSLYDTRAIMSYYTFFALVLNDEYTYLFWADECLDDNMCRYTISSNDPKVMRFENFYNNINPVGVSLPMLNDTEDKHFNGWYTSEDGGTNVGSTYNSKDSATLYARWSDIDHSKCVVTYKDGLIEVYDKGDTLNDRGNILSEKDYGRIIYEYNDNSNRSAVGINYDKLCPISEYRLYSDASYEDLIDIYDYAGQIVLNEDFVYIDYDLSNNYCSYNPADLYVPTPYTSDKAFVAWYTSQEGGTKIDNLQQALDRSSFYWLYAMWKSTDEAVITYENGNIDIVPIGTELTINATETENFTNAFRMHSMYPTSDYNASQEFGYNPEDYYLSPVKTVTTRKWTIDGQVYNPGSTYTVTDDVYIERDRTVSFDVDGFHNISLRSGDEADYAFGTWTLFPKDIGSDDLGFAFSTKEALLNQSCSRESCSNADYYGYWLTSDSDMHIVTIDGMNPRIYYNTDYLYLDSRDNRTTVSTVKFYINNELYRTDLVEDISRTSYYTMNGETYDADDGFVINSSYPKVMDFVSTYGNPTRTEVYFPYPNIGGYTVEGWYTEPDGQGTKYEDYYDGDEDLILYANLVERKCYVYYYDQYYSRYYTDEVSCGSTVTVRDNDLPYNESHPGRGSVIFDSAFDKTTINVQTQRVGNGWSNDYDDHIDDGERIVVNSNVSLYADDTMVTVPVTAPSNDNPHFIGWFSEVEGGEEYVPYSGDETVIYYAHYSGDSNEMVNLIYPDGTWTVPKNSDVYLRINNIQKASEEVATVTFTGYGEGSVTYVYRPNGWIIGDREYDDEDYFHASEDTIINARYIEGYSSPEFPEPEREDAVFYGWFTEPNGQGTKYESYSEPEDITLYPYFLVLEDDEHMYYYNGTYMGIVKDGETASIPYYSGNYSYISTVTLMYNDEVIETLDYYGELMTHWVSLYDKDYDYYDFSYDHFDRPNNRAYITVTSDMPKKMYFNAQIDSWDTDPVNLGNYNLPDTEDKHFDGWYTEPNGQGQKYNYFSENNSRTLYGYYIDVDPTKSTVIIRDMEGGSITKVYNKGETLDRYKDIIFDDWGINYNYNDGSDTNVYVHETISCAPNRYYICNDDSFDWSNPKEVYDTNEDIVLTENYYYIVVGETLLKYCDYDPNELLVPEENEFNAGKEFLGWYSSPNGGDKYTRVSNDMIWNGVYGVWKETSQVIITYEDGTLEMVDPGTVKTVPETRYEDLDVYADFHAMYPTEDEDEFLDEYNNMNEPEDYHVQFRKEYATYKWTVEGVDYNPGESFTVNDNIYVVRDKSESFVMNDYHDLSPRTGDEDRYEFLGWSIFAPVAYRDSFKQYIYSNPQILTDKSQVVSNVFQWNNIPEPWEDNFKVYGIWNDKESNRHLVVFDNNNSTTYYNNGDEVELVEYNNSYMGYCVMLHVTKMNSSSGICYEENTTTTGYTVLGTSYNVNDTFTVTSDMPSIINVISTNDVTNNLNDPLPVNYQFENYHFDGWYTEDFGEGTKYETLPPSNIRNLYAYYVLDKHTVTLPDTTEEYDHGTIYEIPENTYPKENGPGASVTFDLNYENSPESDVRYVTLSYIANGWTIDGKHYDDADTLRLIKDIELIPDYVSTALGVEFPPNPTRDGYDFVGWYDDPTNGTEIDTYAGDNDIVLYAHWEEVQTIKVFKPDNTYDEVDANSDYVLPDNTYNKANTNLATVTFKYYNNRLPDETRYVQTSYQNNGWLVEDVVYDDGETIRVGTHDITLVPNYVETIEGITFPTLTSDDNVNRAWYTSSTCGVGSTATTYNGSTNKTYYEQVKRILHVDYDDGTTPYTINYCNHVEEAFIYTFGTRNKDHYNFLGYTLYIDDEEIEFYDVDEFPASGGPDSELKFRSEYLYDYDGYALLQGTYEPINYRINYTLNGGTANNPTSYNIEDEITLVNPTKAHYTFTGWSGTGLTGDNNMEVTIPVGSYGERSYTAHWTAETITICIDGVCEDKQYGDSYTIPNDVPKANEDLAIVTFVYGNGTSNTTSKVQRKYTQNGWKDQNNQTYTSGQNITLTEGLTLTPVYDEEIIGATFPSDPTREHYSFGGWYNNETPYTEYKGTSDIELTAKWTGDTINICINDDCNEYHYGDEITVPNDIPKANDVIATVTFKKENGEADTTSTVEKQYTQTGWKDQNNQTYTSGQSVTVTGDLTFTPVYSETIIGATFPSDPTKDHYTFEGWYNGDTNYTSYNSEGDIELTARWTGENLTVTHPYGVDNVHYNDSYTLPNNVETKEDTEVGSIYFNFRNENYEDQYEPVMESYIHSGWKIGNTHYNDSATITVTSNITLVPDYVASIIPATFPADPVKDHYTFLGWYDNEDCEGSPITSHSSKTDIEVYACYQGEEVTVTIDGNSTTHRYGDTINLPDLPTSKVENIGTVTFKYHDGRNDLVKNIVKRTSYFNWSIEGDSHEYGVGDPILLDGDKVITSITDIVYDDVDFPEYPQRDHYSFLGWFTLEDGGEEKSQADEFRETTILHAHWVGDPVHITYPNASDEVEYGTSYTILNNNIAKDNTNAATVTFVYGNGNPNTTSYVQKKYTPDGWNEYADGEVITATEDITLTPKYSEELVGASFPINPSREHYSFNGWYNGNTRYTEYKSASNITLTAKWTGETITICIDSNCDEYHYGDEITVPNDVEKANEDVATVTFVYDNGTSNTTSKVQKKFTQTGWKDQNNQTYTSGQKVTATGDLTFTPIYSEEIVGATFPSDPTKEHYSFDGWYNNETPYTEYKGTSDIELTAKWTGDTINICINDDCNEYHYGDEITVPDDVAKANDVLSTVTFKYHNGDDDTTSTVEKKYTQDGWKDQDNQTYTSGQKVNVTKDLTFTPVYDEEIIPATWPSDPTYENHEFDGWFTLEDGGDSINSYSGTSNIDVHAHWTMTLPTDISIDVDNITLIVGETHQIVVVFTPEGTTDTVTFTNYDTDKLSIVDGLVTALAKGETTITVGLENVPNVTKEITVTIISNVLESDVYEVRDVDIENETIDKIVIGAEPDTTIGEFKDNMLNTELIKIYDRDGNELSDDDIVKTGQIIKLEYNGNVYDEAILILRGDIDGDGLIDVTDEALITDHILMATQITGYRFLAADVVEDGLLDVSDDSKITDYILMGIDSVNN